MWALFVTCVLLSGCGSNPAVVGPARVPQPESPSATRRSAAPTHVQAVQCRDLKWPVDDSSVLDWNAVSGAVLLNDGGRRVRVNVLVDSTCRDNPALSAVVAQMIAEQQNPPTPSESEVVLY